MPARVRVARRGRAAAASSAATTMNTSRYAGVAVPGDAHRPSSAAGTRIGRSSGPKRGDEQAAAGQRDAEGEQRLGRGGPAGDRGEQAGQQPPAAAAAATIRRPARAPGSPSRRRAAPRRCTRRSRKRAVREVEDVRRRRSRTPARRRRRTSAARRRPRPPPGSGTRPSGSSGRHRDHPPTVARSPTTVLDSARPSWRTCAQVPLLHRRVGGRGELPGAARAVDLARARRSPC